MSINDFYIILTGSLVAISCGLLGCFLVLRKMSMVSDAISHSVLPGIVIAFLISGTRNTSVIVIGASIVGLLTTFIIEFLHTKGKLQTDASIGVTFTWLFALGVILLSAFAGQVDLDQDCVLYGEIAYVPLDLWTLNDGTNMGPGVIYMLTGVLLVNILFISVFYKELKLTSFDPDFAVAIGISTAVFHYMLMGMVSVTTVASFESVGAILVIALIIGPPATAYLLTHSLKRMLIYTILIGIAITITGYYLAYWIDGSIAGAMATMVGVFFAIAFLFSPEEGIVLKRIRQKSFMKQPG